MNAHGRGPPLAVLPPTRRTAPQTPAPTTPTAPAAAAAPVARSMVRRDTRADSRRSAAPPPLPPSRAGGRISAAGSGGVAAIRGASFGDGVEVTACDSRADRDRTSAGPDGASDGRGLCRRS